MKFLILALDVDLRRRAGDAIHLRELSSNLVRMGHSAEVVVTGGPDTDEMESVPVHVVSGQSVWSVVRQVRPIVSDFHPDVIYERRVSPKVSFVLSRLLRVPFAVEVNGLPDEERSLLLGKDYRPSWLQVRIRGMLLRRAKTIVAVSDSLKLVLTRKYGLLQSRVRVVPNGVNTDLFVPMDRSLCRRRIGLEGSDPVLGFVGSLVPWQGVDNMIQAIAEIHRQGIPVGVLIVGDGPDRTRLEALAKAEGLGGRSTFTGSVPYRDVPTYIGAIDIALSLKPALLPGSPLKVREYMACSRPVIASRGTGYDFGIIEEARAGVLVDPTNVREVVTAIVDLLGDESRRSEMGARGRQFAVLHCTWSLAARRIAAACKG
jgi:starch synthase